jgi:hypothetical protein
MKKLLTWSVPVLTVLVLLCGVASADIIQNFTQTNTQDIPCTSGDPCGTITATQGTGQFANDLVITVQLSGPASHFQLDRFGFNSDVTSGLFLACFNFGSSCSSGVGNASLGGSQQYDGFGKYDYSLDTGLNGGSGCSSDGTGCKTLFTFVIGDSNQDLTVSDLDTNFAGHAANGGASGYIATGPNGDTPEPSTLLLLGSGVLGLATYARRKTAGSKGI